MPRMVAGKCPPWAGVLKIPLESPKNKVDPSPSTGPVHQPEMAPEAVEGPQRAPKRENFRKVPRESAARPGPLPPPTRCPNNGIFKWICLADVAVLFWPLPKGFLALPERASPPLGGVGFFP